MDTNLKNSLSHLEYHLWIHVHIGSVNQTFIHSKVLGKLQLNWTCCPQPPTAAVWLPPGYRRAVCNCCHQQLQLSLPTGCYRTGTQHEFVPYQFFQWTGHKQVFLNTNHPHLYLSSPFLNKDTLTMQAKSKSHFVLAKPFCSPVQRHSLVQPSSGGNQLGSSEVGLSYLSWAFKPFSQDFVLILRTSEEFTCVSTWLRLL